MTRNDARRAAAAGFLLFLAACGNGRLPVLGQVLPFKAKTASAAPWDPAALAGRPWVAGFIFTKCGGPCPAISARMESLQKVLPPEARLVSFTMDPQDDEPPVLAAYAKTFHADPARWFFLRLEIPDLERLMGDQFHLARAEDSAAPPSSRVTHSTMLALVDGGGRVRGYYDSEEDGVEGKLLADLGKLSQESTPQKQ